MTTSNLGLLFCVYACVTVLSHSPLLPVLSKALTDNLPNSLSCMGKGRERGGTSVESSNNDVLLDWLLNPLTPRSDLHVTSPSDIWTLSSKQVMGILKLIR